MMAGLPMPHLDDPAAGAMNAAPRDRRERIASSGRRRRPFEAPTGESRLGAVERTHESLLRDRQGSAWHHCAHHATRAEGAAASHGCRTVHGDLRGRDLRLFVADRGTGSGCELDVGSRRRDAATRPDRPGCGDRMGQPGVVARWELHQTDSRDHRRGDIRGPAYRSLDGTSRPDRASAVRRW